MLMEIRSAMNQIEIDNGKLTLFRIVPGQKVDQKRRISDQN